MEITTTRGRLTAVDKRYDHKITCNGEKNLIGRKFIMNEQTLSWVIERENDIPMLAEIPKEQRSRVMNHILAEAKKQDKDIEAYDGL